MNTITIHTQTVTDSGSTTVNSTVQSEMSAKEYAQSISDVSGWELQGAQRVGQTLGNVTFTMVFVG